MKWKSLFAAALSAVVAWPALAQSSTGGGTPAEGGGLQQAPGTAPGRVISVNFGGGNNATYAIPAGTPYGLVSAVNWNNTTAATGEAIALNASDGTASGATLTYAANATWSDSAASDDPFLQYFLGDNREGGTTITVSNVPFDTYDVIVYINSDTADTSFLPVFINNTKYIGDPETGATVETDNATATFGQTRADAPQYGLNTIRVNGITGDTLAILGSRQQTIDNVKCRCNIAGFQIVESVPLSISVNIEGRNNAGDAPDSIFSDGDAFSGLVPVQNKNWSEIDTPDGESRTVSVEQAIDSTGEATTAAITVSVGGGWHLRRIAGSATRKERLGLMGIGYADAYTSANTPEVVLADIPYTEYSVILYYATDNSGKQWAPAKVTSGDTETYYYYGEDGTLKSDGTSTSTWGSSDDCIAAATTGTLGKDTMRIDGLSGDVSIDLDTSSNNTRGGLSGLQIVCTGKVIVPPPPSINVNFASGRVNAGNTTFDKALTGDTPYGLEPVPGDEWVNLYVSDRTQDVPLALYNGESPLVPSVNYNASGMWSYEGVSGINDLLVAALDDGSALSGTSNNTTITVSDVPFTQYDVIVYLQAEGHGGGFKPVEVNGSYYSWQNGATQAVTDSSDTYAWGTLSQPQPVLGVNALRIAGQTARELTINAPVRTGGPNDSKRCNVAGFQLICTGEVITVDPTKEGVISLNFGSDRRAVPENATTYGLVPVAGKKWQNFSGESGTNVAIMRAENTDLAGAPTVTYTSETTWNTGTNDANPFLQGYLDDGATSDGYGATISVANLPYSAYDVIVYAGYSDEGEDNIHPYEIDGTLYRWDDAKRTTVATTDTTAAASWGSLSATPVYGENALRVRGRLASTLSPLTVKGLPRLNQDAERGGIAALQIVERKLITEDFANALAALAEDTPVYLMPTAPIDGNLTLPDDAVLDLRYVTWDNPVVSGTLTLGANTMIRLPSGRAEYAVANTIAGETASVQVFVHDDPADSVGQLTDGVTISSGGTITRPATYEWVGGTDGNNWSNPANWSSGVVPGADSEVTVSLNANDAKTIVVDTAEATANLFYISGPQTGSATLEIVAAENVEGAKLTVVDKMFTTGNVTVTQKANIAVNGATRTGDVTSGDFVMSNQAIQAGFQVNGAAATYTIASGELLVKVPDTGAGDVSVSNGATLEVGANGTLTAARARITYYGGVAGSTVTAGTLRIAGQANFSTQMGLSMDNYTVDLAGGTMTTPSVRTFNGLTVSAPSVLKAPDGKTLTVSSSNGALTGEGDLTLEGAVTFSAAIPAGYTGELTVADGATVTLGENRPALTVVDGARVNITPTAGELADGRIAFGTSMTADPNNVTFTVDGVEEEITPSVADGVLTLKWESAMPTLATSGTWSTVANWTNLAAGADTAPSTGTVVLDGTTAAITVKLDIALTGMESILVRGDVTLETTDTQTTIPACVTPAEGATLTVGAVQFASGWTLPSGATLKVTDTTTSLFGVTLNGVVELAFSGTTETPATYSAPVSFLGGLTVSGSDVSITDVQLLGDAETRLTGNNVSLTFSGTSFYTRTTLINEGAGNQLLNIQNLNGEILANAGTLALEVALVLNEETSTEENPVYDQNVAPVFKGLTIAEGATVTFTGVGTGGQFAVTGAGTLDMGTFRKQLAGRDGTLVKNLRVTATDDEQKAGEIRFLVQGSPALPEGFQVIVTPAEGAAAWEPTWDLNGQNLVITNVPPTPVMSVTGNWSAGPWSTGTVPTTGEVILDGGSAGIVVTMDTALDAAIAVTVRGAVTLKTSATQTTLPDNITLEEGASLGVEYAAATTDDISDLAITRGLAITGNNVTVTAGTISGGSVTLSGGQASLTVATLAKGVNVTSAAANVSLTVTDHFGEIGATTGNPTITVATATFSDLTLNTCRGLGGVRIEADASLRLASTWAAGQELHATGDGYLDMTLVAAENRPTLARWGSTLTTLPKTIQVTASEAENTAGKVELDLVVPSGNNDTAYVTLPEGFVAQVTYGLAHWEVASTVISEDHSKLVITKAAPDVSPSLPEGSTLSEAATAALNAAAEKAGFTGEYAVAITTGGETVQVTTAEAATQLQEVLECFTDLTLKATTEGGNTVTVVYDFGVVGIKRNTSDNGWVVTAKVQGENAAPAGFAAGNAYTLTVNGTEVSVANATVNEGGTVTLPLADSAVQGDDFTLGVSVSRTAQQL